MAQFADQLVKLSLFREKARYAGLSSFMMKLIALLVFSASTSFSYSEALSPNYLGVGAQLNDVSFSEQENGQLLNEETGQLPFAEITLGHRRTHNLYFQASLASGATSLTYQGETQLGRTLSTQSDRAITRAEAFAGRDFDRSALFAGVAFELDERIIQPSQGVSGLQESSRRIEGFIGAERTLIDLGGSRLCLEGRVYTGISGEMRVNYGGRYDDASVDIGNTVMTQIRLVWVGEWKNGWALQIAPILAYRRSDRSAATHLYRAGEDTSLSFYQPPTTQRSFGVSAALYRYF